jgi:hypothetical protein
MAEYILRADISRTDSHCRKLGEKGIADGKFFTFLLLFTLQYLLFTHIL